jgi:segregation and condensation protein A
VSFEIKLPLFEGPFDLLLFFIERDELDIYDIPIARITDEFLAYLHQLETLNIEVASEFILVAAKLMRIKARMLLPRPEFDEEGREIDPREELVKHLLEYKKFKEVVARFAVLEDGQLQREKRGNLQNEIKKLAQTVDVEGELQHIDLYKLLVVFQRVMHRYELEASKPVHTVVQYPYTIEAQKEFILGRLIGANRLSFLQVVDFNRDRIAVIYNFLAILELLQSGQLKVYMGEGYNNFWVERAEGEPVR